MTGVVVLGQALLSPPEPYVADDHSDLCYVPLCPCGGVETRRTSLGVLCCADCGAVLR